MTPAEEMRMEQYARCMRLASRYIREIAGYDSIEADGELILGSDIAEDLSALALIAETHLRKDSLERDVEAARRCA